MFNLVADVDRYPEFLPFCESLTVRARDKDGDKDVVIADMTIGYKLVRETITSRVTFDRENLKITSDNVSGPFRKMHNVWTFQPAGTGACEICFFISYEFKNRALSVLVGGLFDRVFRRFADAFETRADVIFS